MGNQHTTPNRSHVVLATTSLPLLQQRILGQVNSIVASRDTDTSAEEEEGVTSTVVTLRKPVLVIMKSGGTHYLVTLRFIVVDVDMASNTVHSIALQDGNDEYQAKLLLMQTQNAGVNGRLDLDGGQIEAPVEELWLMTDVNNLAQCLTR